MPQKACVEKMAVIGLSAWLWGLLMMEQAARQPMAEQVDKTPAVPMFAVAAWRKSLAELGQQSPRWWKRSW
jgi:hypothetical protein